jgi:ATP-dependent Clp protease, protease subunit
MWADVTDNQVKLYGTIYSGDGPYIDWSLEQVYKNYSDVDVLLHTPGGSVFDGNLIYNAIMRSSSKNTMHIVGLAASMGSIIMLSGVKIIMAENAFIMVHAPSGYVEGNAGDFESSAELLRQMETNFLSKIAAKTGKSVSAIKNLMVGDNWFSAQKALEYGLIDEIASPTLELDATAIQQIDFKSLTKSPSDLFKDYDSKGKTSLMSYQANLITPIPPQHQTPNNEEMKLNPKAMVALALTVANPTDDQINAAIEALAAKAENAEAELKKVQDEQKVKDDERAEALIDAAQKAGKFLGSERAAWLADAMANYSMTERVLAKMPGKESLVQREVPDGSSDTTHKGQENWGYHDWRKKDPAGLLQMKSADPDKYNTLYANRN